MLHALSGQTPLTDVLITIDTHTRRTASRMTAPSVSHVTPATRLRELQALESRHTRPLNGSSQISLTRKEFKRTILHSFEPYLCNLEAWIQPQIS